VFGRGAPVPGTEGSPRSERVSELLPPEVVPDRLLDDAGAAELLNVPKSWVGEAARAGRLPHVKLGRYRRFDRAELLAWVEAQKAGGGGRRRPRAVA
jgi:excisionase family DNA binding protein